MKRHVKTIPDLIERDRRKGQDVFEQLKSRLSKENVKNKETWAVLMHTELTSSLANGSFNLSQQKNILLKVVNCALLIDAALVGAFQFLSSATNTIKYGYIALASTIILFVSIAATWMLSKSRKDLVYYRSCMVAQKELRNRISGLEKSIESYVIKYSPELEEQLDDIKNDRAYFLIFSVWFYPLVWIAMAISSAVLIYLLFKDIL